MKAKAAQHLERRRDKALVIDGLGEFDVTKISRIRLVGNASQPRIIGAAIDGLSVKVRFVASDSGWYFAAIDGNGLRDAVLALSSL